jgi:phage N-6-adenine-methyltransferase
LKDRFGAELESPYDTLFGERHESAECSGSAAHSRSVMGSSKRMVYSTPTALYRALDEEFGFTLDVCSSAGNEKCKRFFTLRDNGLAQEWGHHICWMNPPYGRYLPKWMQRAWEASQHGATVVCLVPSRTDTRWWHDYAMQGEIRFIKGRLTFEGERNPAPFPCSVVIFRGKV